MPEELIKKIGKYEIVAEIGKGAMGVVYKAIDPFIGRAVAIKTINQAGIDADDAATVLLRFRREAQAAGRINHPNIVSVYDYGEENNIAYIVMEYVEGNELTDFLDKGEVFSPEQAVVIMSQVLSALDCAHRQGVIHRDIKPANIMIMTGGGAKITDFGVAKIDASNLTRAGSFLGTPSYTSPEQFTGEGIDCRSDIFSAGVVFYQMLTGEKPFAGSLTTTIHRILNVEPEPVSKFNSNIPQAFNNIVKKAIAKEPRDRFQSAAEFLNELEKVFVKESPNKNISDKSVVKNTMGLSLDKLSLLLVEDNQYICSIMKQILKQFGFGQVFSATNGMDAMMMLDESDSRYVGQVDIIVSDMVMSPIDGIALLKWVRTSKSSPNRFIPFIIVSGVGDKDKVTACRNNGVTDFVAKPISPKALYERILKVIIEPKQFVSTKTYFGPDRRTIRREPPQGLDRRKEEEQKATVIYVPDKEITPAKTAELFFYKISQTLKEKAGGANIDGTIDVPEDILDVAEKTLQLEALDFNKLATMYAEDMLKYLDLAKSKKETRASYISKINMIAHELRGQGGTLGYPLITSIARSLFDATEADKVADSARLDVIKAHIEAIQLVIRENIVGDGGETGRWLLGTLKLALDK